MWLGTSEPSTSPARGSPRTRVSRKPPSPLKGLQAAAGPCGRTTFKPAVTRRKWVEVIGIIGMTFGIIAWGLVANLRKEFEALKKNLEASGVLKE